MGKGGVRGIVDGDWLVERKEGREEKIRDKEKGDKEKGKKDGGERGEGLRRKGIRIDRMWRRMEE